jgi:hypothetical protein
MFAARALSNVLPHAVNYTLSGSKLVLNIPRRPSTTRAGEATTKQGGVIVDPAQPP